MKPVRKPTQTWDGLWALSRKRDESISPLASIITSRYQVSGVCIFNEREKTVAVSATAPTACIDIFHQKFIIDTTIATTDVAKMNDFRKKGI